MRVVREPSCFFCEVIFENSTGHVALCKHRRAEVFYDNLVEWNGYSGLDGPGTVTFSGNDGPTR